MPHPAQPDRSRHRLRFRVMLLAGWLSLTAIAWTGTAAARQPAALWVDVADAYLELHTGPGRGYPVTQVVARGERVQVLKRRTDWYFLETAGGHRGWARHRGMERTLLALNGNPVDEGFRSPEQRQAALAGAPATSTPGVSPPPASSPPVRSAGPTLIDTNYPEADDHRWEAGAGGGRRRSSKVLRATLSYLIDRNLAVEATLSQVLDGPRDEDLALVGLTHHFRPDDRFSPYVSVGLGLSRLHRDGIDPPSTREVGYAAAGFRYLLQRRLAFRADYRNHVVISGSGNPKETSEWNVGFVFLF